MRIEDTDQKRYVPGAEDELMSSLRWLGLDWDEGPDAGGPHAPYRQSERREIYIQYANQLVDSGHAYHCFCTPQRLAEVRQEQRAHKLPIKYDGTCRRLSPEEARARLRRGEPSVIRFKMPRQGSITARDLLRGDITVENNSLDDNIIVKSDGLALYHLAAMVDDHLMGITHVIRGSEWLSTFLMHVHIYRAFGWQQPVWVHLSIFLKPSGKGKMSKRETTQALKDGKSIFIGDLKDMGYIPEGVINWISLMGWSYDDHTEFFTMTDLIEKFSLEKLNPSPAAINYSKLDHFNGLHIRAIEAEDLARRIAPFIETESCVVSLEKLIQAAPLVQTRLATLDEAPKWLGFLFTDTVNPQPQNLVAKKMTAQESAAIAHKALDILKALPSFDRETTQPPMRTLVEELGIKAGQLFHVLRVAVTGQKVSPPLFESMEILGRDTSLARIEAGIAILESYIGENQTTTKLPN